MADRISSRQIPMVLGLFAIGGATALLCVGNSAAILVIGRVLQGSAAAMIWYTRNAYSQLRYQ